MNTTGSAFLIDGEPITELSDAALRKAAQRFATELQAATARLAQAYAEAQLASSMLNVSNFELDRRVRAGETTRPN